MDTHKINILLMIEKSVSVVKHALNEPSWFLEIASTQAQATDILRQNTDVALIVTDVSVSSRFVLDMRSLPDCASLPILFLDQANEMQNMPRDASLVDVLHGALDEGWLRNKVATFVTLYRLQRNHQHLCRELTTKREIVEDFGHGLTLSSAVFEAVHEGLMVTDADAHIVAVNTAFCNMSGYIMEELMGRTPDIFRSDRHSPEFYQKIWQTLREKGQWVGVIYNRKKDTAVCPESVNIMAVKDMHGKITNYLGVYTSVAETDKGQLNIPKHDQLHFLAHYDTLTELPNRAFFQATLKQALSSAKRTHTNLAVMFLDLDRFKRINDTLGHDFGDALLKEVARRVQACIRDSDVFSRQGGDEFTGMLVNIQQTESAAVIAGKMIDTLKAPFEYEGKEMAVTTSIGISIYPDDGEDVDTLLKRADAAMYQAKDAGRNNYQFYTHSQHTAALQRMKIETHLRHALENDEFYLHYQPQIETKTELVTGAEALLRWNNAKLGFISPAVFIPIAEECGMIVEIGDWVLHTACQQTKAWQDAGLPPILMAVNLSSRQFANPKFDQIVKDVLVKYDLAPKHLELELTERIIMQDDEQTEELLLSLYNHGIQLSVDDFGTGYSSMSYLKRFKVNKLKIDKSFVDNLVIDIEDQTITSAMIMLAHNLGLTAIAEGVEDRAQADWLREHDCDEIQGYFYGKPMAANDFVEFLKRNHT